MGEKVTFYPEQKLIVVDQAPVSGVVEIDVQVDLYSDGKEDWLEDSSLNKFVFPMYSVGGNPLPGSKSLGDTYFLKSGWQIRPYEASHTLRITGNLYEETGASLLTPTLGTYTVLAEMVVSNLSDSTVQQLKELQYASFQDHVWYDANSTYSGVDYPNGNREYPLNNFSDVVSVANDYGFKKVGILSNGAVGSGVDFDSFTLVGSSHVNIAVVIDTGALVTNTVFSEMEISGVLDGGNDVRNCIVKDLEYVNGHIHNSSLEGTIVLGGNEDAVFIDCKQSNMGVIPELDMGGTGQSASLPGYDGTLLVTNFDSITDNLGIGLRAGKIILDSTTVVQGTISVSGIGTLVDENDNDIQTGVWNTGVDITNNLVSKENIAEATLKSDLSKYATSPETVAMALMQQSYGNQVHIDTANGGSGQAYPKGLDHDPVDNLADALAIASAYGLSELHFKSDYTFTASDSLANFDLYGAGLQKTTFTFESGCVVAYCNVYDAKCTGYLTGVTGFFRCLVYDLGSTSPVPSSQPILIQNCLVQKGFSIPVNYSGEITVTDCYSLPDTIGQPPTISFGNSAMKMNVRDHSGGFKITDVSQTNRITVSMIGGVCTLDSADFTDGLIKIAGIGRLIDENGDTIPTGTWNSNVTVINGLLESDYIGTSVWDKLIVDNTVVGSVGEAIEMIKSSTKNKVAITTDGVGVDTVTVYKDDGVSVSYQVQVSSDKKDRIPV